MATWAEMSWQSYKSAEQLRRLKSRRACISRAYYAAFSAVTGEVRKLTFDFPKGYEHPPHAEMGGYIKRYLTRFDKTDRNNLRMALRRLRQARVEADYRPDADPKDTEVRKAMMDARYVLETLGTV